MIERIREARKNESGFTLIELLIVIVILGVLAAVVVFAVGGITDKGHQSACKADVKSVESAVEAWAANQPGTVTYPADDAAAQAAVVPGYLHSWPAGTVVNYTLTAGGKSFTVTGTNGADTC
jgi:general secretion pathway protein G